ncbi:MAG TPA: hypothetical protein PLN06_01000 [Bacteroidales bacterium]|nr:hypothetical protein [Bacteroidales bacterium]HCI55259.1 hypothetical protein [Bacteroidales bacterium]HOU95188.1 hypothetical protein [Bacteroidales bacterium]HQJ20794.1 hypothetical protein [Bacteroidales bacterium]HRC89923.1 hypothetical protein [Bacteroidales bacterium]
MKHEFIFILILVLAITGCKKEPEPVYSGIVTINNKRAGTDPTYYLIGFHVPTGRTIPDVNNQLDVISVLSDYDVTFNAIKLYFVTNNFKNSFFRYGQYKDTEEAKTAFDSLISFTEPQWTEIGDSVKINQIWLYRTSDQKYAKLRIIDTVLEKRDYMLDPYAECTFEWVFQPDGTKSFPGK